MEDYTLPDSKKALDDINNERKAKHSREVERCISKAYEGKKISPREFSNLSPKEIEFYNEEASRINKGQNKGFANFLAKCLGSLRLKAAEDYIQYKINKPKVKAMISAFQNPTSSNRGYIPKSSIKSNDRGIR